MSTNIKAFLVACVLMAGMVSVVGCMSVSDAAVHAVLVQTH
jgi:hypothetical protein